ncbi:hypothetical protein [Algoriphagus terrigena]|uniref:hypothetical protein n=1 Tax=Algoriphagus terrigena TaxID=344884 RepID=UPI000478B85E|nr:hypothetical protein [Algoriphagus terrigena]
MQIRGTMEDKYTLLREKGVFEEYEKIHLPYADKAEEDLESLKRGLFIQWYAITEPGCITRINELNENATCKIIRQIDTHQMMARGQMGRYWNSLNHFAG